MCLLFYFYILYILYSIKFRTIIPTSLRKQGGCMFPKYQTLLGCTVLNYDFSFNSKSQCYELIKKIIFKHVKYLLNLNYRHDISNQVSFAWYIFSQVVYMSTARIGSIFQRVRSYNHYFCFLFHSSVNPFIYYLQVNLYIIKTIQNKL